MMTFDTTPSKPREGDVWHVKMPGQQELTTVRVIESTAMTVQVHDASESLGRFCPVRYEHGAIKFVEKVR